jgi:hypothetical protein
VEPDVYKEFRSWLTKIDEQISHIKDKQRVLCRHDLWCAVVGDARRLLVPPQVAALRPWDLIPCALEDKDVLDVGAGFECRVDDGLRGNALPTATAFVSGKDDAALTVKDAVAKSFCGKASKHDRVDGTDASAGEEGSDGLPCHRKIDGDSIAFPDTEGLEHIGNAGDFVEQLRVGDVSVFIWFIGFVDDGSLGVYDQSDTAQR